MPSNENGGRINYEYIVYEKPIQESKKQGVENLYVENQEVENPGQLNTKKLNTNNKENINIEYILEKEIKAKKSKEDKILLENVKCIIDYLNESIGSKYKYTTKGTIKDIKARFKEGYELDDFYDVIDKKVKEWLNTDMEQYLRPSTLFGNKFENYFNQKNYFNGKPKTSYSSKPTFDNTANHFTGNKRITDEELDKMTFDEKVNYVSNLPVADMTPYQKLFFENHCLARDENGNLLKF